MSKRILSVILTLCLLCALLPAAALPVGAERSDTDITYPVEGGSIYFDKATGTITDCDWSVTKADIPPEIDRVAVTSIGVSAFFLCDRLTSVSIPESVTSIGGSAFESCDSLTSVTIPESVTSIGYSAFARCDSLTAIDVAAGNTEYCSADGTLFNKEKSDLIAYPAGKTETEYCIPDSVTSIGGGAFYGCSSLTSVTIPESVTSIGDDAFFYCSSLTSVTIPESVTSIGDFAFNSCWSLTSVTIPESVTSVGDWAFSCCGSLTGIWVDENNLSYSSDEFGVLFNKDKTELIQAPGAIPEYTIPDSVTSIGWDAFEGCNSLTSVTIPNSVTSIGYSAFYACSSLTSVTIPNSVTTIGEETFKWCSSLMSVTIPNSVTSIGYAAFSGCSSLTSVTIPDSVTSIGGYAFYYCSSLASVTIPDSVTSIGEGAFTSCSSLASVTIPDSVTSIGDEAFRECSSLTSVCFEGNAPEIGESVFQMWDAEAGEYVNIPNLTLYYIEGKDGWTSPTWNGYPTATWDGVHVPHTHNYTAAVTAPTCTEKGYTTHTCECGDSYIDTYVDALGHAWDNGVVTVEPTETEEGVKTFTCTRCEDTKTESIPALNHSHSYTTVVTAPTCTEKGYTTHTCACGDSYVDTYVDALGHDYQDGVCTRCGEKDPDWVEPKPPESYEDVSEDAWYYDAVQYATNNGLMNGVGGGNFDPEGSMTRAMLVTVLWRYEGSPMGYDNPFTDVNATDGSWYIDAVAWAAANEIVGGVGDNKFDPDGNVTREQMAAILFRYANKEGIDTGKRGELGSFPDAGKISLYAKDAIAWTVAEGIINGSDGRLLPQGDATRSQVSAILMRFIENIVKK